MTFEEWEETVPESLKGDLLWKMKAYRLAVFISDIGWHDVTKLSQDVRTQRLSTQLYASLGSISANLAEGHSRTSGKDRARIHEIALGEAAEAREWYWKGRHILGEPVAIHRMDVITEIIKLLKVMVPSERQSTFRDERETYDVN